MLPRFPTSNSRLFGVLAHVDAGKTTLSERVLYFSGRIHRMGEVHDGNTTLDHSAEEKAHGITISAAATTTRWRAHESVETHALTLIDTPGHIDFAVEVERSLRVLDGAIVVLDASRGVEPQTESVSRQADRHGVPRLVFVNKLDAVGASVDMCLNELRSRLNALPIPLQLLRDGELIDLITQEALRFSKEGTLERRPVQVGAERAHLVEQVADIDPQLLDEWLQSGEVSSQQLRAALRRATLQRLAVPVLFGSALKNRGIQPLLDAVVDYLPSPVDRPLPSGLRPVPDAPPCAFVFKTEVDPHVGSLSWARVFQGTLRPGDSLEVARLGESERISRVLSLHGGAFEPLDSLGPGGIAALVGLKSARTGDTVRAKGLSAEFASLETAEPVVELALEARSAEDQAKLTQALRAAATEDPSLRVRVDAESGQTVLCGVGELHLSIWLEKLARRDGLEVRAGAAQVAYRDTIGVEATVTWKHQRQTGGPGQYAVVTVRVQPLERGAGVRFVDETKGGVVPQPFVAAVNAGVRAALSRGVREDVPVVDVEVTLLDGQVHVRDSSAVAFEVAGSLAVVAAVERAGLVRLEPVAEVVVTAPEAVVGAVLGELGSRGAQILSVTSERGASVVVSSLPVRTTFGLMTALRSRSEGRAAMSMRPTGYR